MRFVDGPVIQTVTGRDGHPAKRVRAAGRFHGHCDAPTAITDLLFEAVPVARVEFSWSGSDGHDPPVLHVGQSPRSVQVLARDAQGRDFAALSQPEAHWTLGQGCEGVLRATVGTAGVTSTMPTDSVDLTPVAAGQCRVEVEFLGVRGATTVTVQ